jgi:hypothetical protein
MPNRAERRAAERAKNKPQATEAAAPVQEPTEQTFAAAANASEPQPEPKPISEARLKANRANAKLSTGPSTFAGLEAAARNRLAHGLARHNGHFDLLTSEDIFEFEAFKDAMLEEHQPATLTETILVHSLVESHWLANRALRLADACFDPLGHQIVDEKKFALYQRYQTTHTRAFHKALNDLLKLRAEQRKAEIGFEAQKLKQSAEQRAVETLELKKQVFELQKEVVQMKKNRAPAAPPTQADAETSPGVHKMAA